jgi:serine/threonine protein kinase
MNSLAETENEIVRRIGEGSFSNVFLCKTNESVLIQSETPEYFIIKEINTNQLVKNYLNINKGSVKNIKRLHYKSNGIKGRGLSVTPHNTSFKNEEQEYYYNKLNELIGSEIEILSNLDNTNIIKFYGYTKRKGIYYLRMEYCEGGDLYEYLKGDVDSDKRNTFGGMNNNFLYDFLKQTTSGLKYLHDKNIIHRDIKLHNILIFKQRGNYIFKLTDFGFACFDNQNERENKRENKRDELCVLDDSMREVLVKKYYKLCGTPYYMAPEILKNLNLLENITKYSDFNKSHVFYDKRIDVWSYGICIYELLFNRLPFPGVTNITKLIKIYKGGIDKKICKRLDDNLTDMFLKDLLLNMLKEDYHKRYYIYQVSEKLDSFNISDLSHSSNIDSYKEHCSKNNETKTENVNNMHLNIIRNPVLFSINEKSWERISFEIEMEGTKVEETRMEVEMQPKSVEIKKSDKFNGFYHKVNRIYEYFKRGI